MNRKYNQKKTQLSCPCGSKKNYFSCCQIFISKAAFPETPEQLMRSRYTAYTQANVNYIAETMRGPAAKNYDQSSAKEWAASVQWIRLKVLYQKCGLNLDVAFVEFIAVFSQNGIAQKIHEKSEFRRVDGRWYYWDSIQKNRSA